MDILQHYSKNSSILVDLRIAAAQLKKALLNPSDKRRSVASTGRVGKVWKLTDRLTEEEMRGMVQARADGLSIKNIGRKFGISESSAKRILRFHRASVEMIKQSQR